MRYENDELATVLAAWGKPNMDPVRRSNASFRGDNSGDYVYQTHRPARQHGFKEALATSHKLRSD